jgi:hypothetical protein
MVLALLKTGKVSFDVALVRWQPQQKARVHISRDALNYKAGIPSSQNAFLIKRGYAFGLSVVSSLVEK